MSHVTGNVTDNVTRNVTIPVRANVTGNLTQSSDIWHAGRNLNGSCHNLGHITSMHFRDKETATKVLASKGRGEGDGRTQSASGTHQVTRANTY
jgi:hypothetical protein